MHLSCICRAVPCPSPNSSRLSYHLSYRLCGSRSSVVRHRPPPQLPSSIKYGSKTQDSRPPLSFQYFICKRNTAARSTNTYLLINKYIRGREGSLVLNFREQVRSSHGTIACRIKIGLFFDSYHHPILTTETETNIPVYFSDEIKTVATSRHPSKCLV